MTVEMMPSAREIALANVVVDIEKGAARVGWDHAPSIYALVPTALLLADPNLPADIAAQLRAGWDGSEEHLSAVIQEDFADDDIERILAHLAWPETVPGAALTVERIVVPPEVEDEAPRIRRKPSLSSRTIRYERMFVWLWASCARENLGAHCVPAPSIPTTRSGRARRWSPHWWTPCAHPSSR